MCSLKCTSYVKLPWVSPVGVSVFSGSPFFGPKNRASSVARRPQGRWVAMDGGTGSPASASASAIGEHASASASPASASALQPAETAEMYGNLHEYLNWKYLMTDDIKWLLDSRPTSCRNSWRCVECRMISQCHCLTWKLWESEPGMVWVWEWIWKKKSISCNLEVKRLKLHWK